MWGEAGEERFGCWVGLWDEKVAELADDEFAWADGRSVVGELGNGRGFVGTGWTWDGVSWVLDEIVLGFADGCVSVTGVVRTMPVLRPFGGVLFEDGPALTTEDVVS